MLILFIFIPLLCSPSHQRPLDFSDRQRVYKKKQTGLDGFLTTVLLHIVLMIMNNSIVILADYLVECRVAAVHDRFEPHF